jgi:hypothetical protein
MASDETRRALKRAFHELTLNLIGLFELYEADPELVEGAAEALGKVYRAHLQQRPAPQHGRGREAMDALLDEMEAAVGAA